MAANEVKFYNGPLQNFNTDATIKNGIYFAKDGTQVVGLIYHDGKWYGADTLDLVWNPSTSKLSWFNFNPDTKEYEPTVVDFSSFTGNAETIDNLTADVSALKNLLLVDKEGNDASVIDTWNEVMDFLKGVNSGELSILEMLGDINASISSLQERTVIWKDLDGNPLENF